MVLRIVLVRHGLSSFNKDGLIQGRTDESYLTEEGYEQAQLTGAVLKDISFDQIYSSPLRRAAETARTIEKSFNKRHKINFDENLLEVDLANWSGLKINEIKTKFPDAYKLWKENPENLIIRRDEKSDFMPIKELYEQAQKFLEYLIEKNKSKEIKNILIIAHNAILRCLILSLINKPSKGFRKIKLDNASISILNIRENNDLFNAQIECINQTSHLGQNIPKQIGDSRIVLVRHGETNWNKEGRFQGQIDIPLNENGKQQAQYASDYLRDISFDKAYSSSMIRPYETAEIILQKYKNLEIEKVNDLVEISHGLWEGKLESEILAEWPELLRNWHEKPEKVQMPEGESIKTVSVRSILAWQKICNEQAENTNTLVVAHDAVNKTIICHLLNLDCSNIWMIKQGNGGITVIDIFEDPEKDNVISSLNITTHLGSIIDSTASGAL